MENEVKNVEPFDVYCNGVELAMSPFDFTLLLKSNSPKGEKFLGQVRMSPEHAKVLVNIMAENLKKFEELFGGIPEVDMNQLQKLQAEGKITIEQGKK